MEGLNLVNGCPQSSSSSGLPLLTYSKHSSEESKSQSTKCLEKTNAKIEAKVDCIELGRLELHPLQNPTILANLFQHCPPGTLASCRLVCRQWRDISLKTWRSSFPLIFRHYNRYEDVLLASCYHNDYRGTPLREFLSFWENDCESKPYSQFQLVRVNFPFEQKQLALQIDRLLKLIGLHVTKMNLELCYFAGPNEFLKVIYRAVPNLRYLALRDCSFGLAQSAESGDEEGLGYVNGPNYKLRSLCIEIEKGTVLPVSWLELLSHFPSIHIFTLRGLDGALPASDYVHVLEMIQTIRKRAGDRDKLPLKRFDFGENFKITSNIECLKLIALLHQLQIPMSSAKVGPGMNEGIITDILKWHGNSLVKISAVHSTSLPNFAFPSGMLLENLQELQIWEGFCRNLEFFKCMPNLKKLHITADNFLLNGIYAQPRQFLPDANRLDVGMELSKLEELRLDPYMNVTYLETIIHWMPNMKRLKMKLNDKKFSLICWRWRELVEVEDFGCQLTDEGVTGIRFPGEGQNLPNEIRPNITLLKGVKRFTSRSRKLTDRSVHYGFLKLTDISYVSLSSRSQITDEAKNALRDRCVSVEENNYTFPVDHSAYLR